MHIDFPLILTLLVLISGVIALLDIIFWAKKRNKKQKKPIVIEYSRSFFPILLIVLVIRSFLIQPYRVPTGSLEPTILPGDFIAVSQFAYGLRLPVLNYKIVKIGEPKRGDIALFRWPENPSIIFIKRVVGVPGDHIVYRNKILKINGVIARQKLIGNALDVEPDSLPVPVQKKMENLLGVKHSIFVQNQGGDLKTVDTIVPKGFYFMMGDNRDASDDSRYWGFVPEQNLVGKAFVTWMSWNSEGHSIRWHRIGKTIR
ncbi:MAG: signal peptidase I [Gammaproteobacteria bacterium]|nr:signal peptidase I [Gammaproteobacteria bacterium]